MSGRMQDQRDKKVVATVERGDQAEFTERVALMVPGSLVEVNRGSDLDVPGARSLDEHIHAFRSGMTWATVQDLLLSIDLGDEPPRHSATGSCWWIRWRYITANSTLAPHIRTHRHSGRACAPGPAHCRFPL